MSARFNVRLQPAFGCVRGVMEHTGRFNKTERTNIAYGVLDELVAMPAPDRLTLARELAGPGYAVVPVEPTDEMVHSGACALEVGVRMEGPMNSSKYKAAKAYDMMLTAAQEPTP